MADPSEQDIRDTLNITDANILRSAMITLMISDAKAITGSNDEISLRYYACYLTALNWDIINGVNKIEDTSFNAPDPNRCLKAYELRQKQLMLSKTSNKVPLYKVAINKDFFYDETNKNIRLRLGSDPDEY